MRYFLIKIKTAKGSLVTYKAFTQQRVARLLKRNLHALDVRITTIYK